MVNIWKTIISKVWKLVLGFFGVVRRAFCCFRRRRRASDVGLPVSVSDLSDQPVKQQAEDLQSWDAWNEDDPTCVTVDVYGGPPAQPSSSQRSANGPYRPNVLTRSGSGDSSQKDPDEDVDFFKDMTPRVVRQKKVSRRAFLSCLPRAKLRKYFNPTENHAVCATS